MCIDTHVSVMLKFIRINKEKEISAKQGIHKWHRQESINMIVKYIVHIHISAELKAYWLSCLT